MTKPSIVTGASVPVRLLFLFAAPFPFLLWVVLAVPAAAIDARRRQPAAYWLAAIVPTAIITSMLVVSVDAFTRTVFGVGIISTDGYPRALYLIAVLAAAAWILQLEALRLARPAARREGALAAALLVLSLIAQLAVSLDSESSGVRARPAAAAAAFQNFPAPNILLVGIDGIVAGETSPYGAAAGATPALDTLAARGIVFENAFSNAGRTYGSLISMLTGRLPSETHILFPPVYLTGDAATNHLPGLLRARGYTTALIGMRHYSDAEDWNMIGGFDLVNGRRLTDRDLAADRSETQERLRRYRRELTERLTSRILHLTFVRRMEDEYAFLVAKGVRSPYFADEHRIRMAEAFLQARREPWMLHLHLVDTHCCGDDQKAQVRGADRNVARIVEILQSIEQLDRTLIVVYSDHTRRWGTLGRLPLIVVVPGRAGGVRIRPNVQLADIAPTIVDVLRGPKPEWMSGESLLDDAARRPARPIFSLVDLAQMKVSGPQMKVLQDASPPFYGARSAAVVVCDQWVKHSFDSGAITSGAFADHTAPCRDPSLAEYARSELEMHLAANGYLEKK